MCSSASRTGEELTTLVEHIDGWNWTDASVAGEFPVAAEIEDQNNWSRSWPEREMFNFVALRSKNG